MSGPDCFVVVRAAGERTEAACARLAGLEVGAAQVAVIHEVPFAAAVRRGFELGVASGRPWTLCLDADVLLRPGAIGALAAAAERDWAAAPDLFEIEGLVADKLLGQMRPAGVHLYRTGLLREALEHVEFDARKRRPETQVKKQMRARGYRIVQVDLVSGLHDHEQFHRDIFRKTFTHLRKHERFMGYARRYWRRRAPADPDLRVAYLSYCLSRAVNAVTDLADVPENERVRIDLRAFPSNLDAILTPAGLEEKAPLAADALGPDAVEAMLAAFAVAPEFRRVRHLVAARHWAGQTRLAGLARRNGPRAVLRRYAPRPAAARDPGRK